MTTSHSDTRLPGAATVLWAFLAALSTDPAAAAERNLGLLPAMHGGLSGIEIAGADESDKATQEQLRRADTPMDRARPAKPAAAKPKMKQKPARLAKPAEAPMKAEPKPARTAKPLPKLAAPEPAPAGMMADPGAAFGPYVRADATYGISRDSDAVGATGALSGVDIDDTASFRGGIGFRFDDMLRMDGTVGYRLASDVDARDGLGRATDTEVDALTAMVSAYVDLTPLHAMTGSDMVTPYVGAGIGFARLSTDSRRVAGAASEGDADSDNLAYQIMAGVSVKMSARLFVDLGYRFANLGQFEQSGSFSDGSTALRTEFDDLMVHEASLGLRLRF